MERFTRTTSISRFLLSLQSKLVHRVLGPRCVCVRETERMHQGASASLIISFQLIFIYVLFIYVLQLVTRSTTHSTAAVVLTLHHLPLTLSKAWDLQLSLVCTRNLSLTHTHSSTFPYPNSPYMCQIPDCRCLYSVGILWSGRWRCAAQRAAGWLLMKRTRITEALNWCSFLSVKAQSWSVAYWSGWLLMDCVPGGSAMPGSIGSRHPTPTQKNLTNWKGTRPANSWTSSSSWQVRINWILF